MEKLSNRYNEKKISTRIISGFLIVAIITVIIGVIGIVGFYASGDLLRMWILVGGVVLAVIVCMLVGTLISNSITLPLNELAEYCRGIANGERSSKIAINSADEIGTVANAVIDIQRTLETLIVEIDKVANAVSLGNLTVRGSDNLLKGGYGNIIKEINNIVQAIFVPVDEAKTMLGKMCANDFEMQMKGDYTGTFKEFSELMNLLQQRLIGLQNAFTTISKGDISLLEAYQKLGKRSDNDKIMPAVIAMMQAIQNMIDESNVLAAAAIEGNLSSRGDENKFEGGFRHVIKGLNNTMDAVERPLNEISNVLGEIASGNMTVSMNGDYRGEYANIKEAMNNTINSISNVLSEISGSSDQVASGSKQVSIASQALSQGATEQASSIEELTASITEIAAQTRQNASNAAEANKIATKSQNDAQKGNEHMNELLKSMSEISEASSNISKIIKVIDDISFQTNMLALNAAVEAARAGQYGKGFAVVAEEVRNLAAKSANAVKDTTSMIEGTIAKTKVGAETAKETSESFKKIVQGLEDTAKLVADISLASDEQANGISQIDTGIEQVSQVVQTNSATAEESAASSEELSTQAELLKDMVGKFKLKKSEGQQKDSYDNHSKEPYRLAAAASNKSKILLSDSNFGKY